MIENTIKEIVMKTLNIPEEKYSEELGSGDIIEWDSMAHVRLLQAVEVCFNFTFDVSDAIDIETVEDLIFAVKKCLGRTE